MPSSIYNLRSRSTSVSPVKRAAGSPEKKTCPAKKTKLIRLEEISEIPNVIVDALHELGFETLEELKAQDSEILATKAAALTFKGIETKEEQSIIDKMKTEIFKAWIRYLVASASGSNRNLTLWRDWAESKIAERTKSFDDISNLTSFKKIINGSSAENLQAELVEAAWQALIAIRPRDLVRQRQALKKAGRPKGEEKITFVELRQGKAGLRRIPTGEAISSQVNPVVLQQQIQSLKKV